MLTFQQSFLWNSRLKLSEPRQRAAECFTSRVVGRRKSIRRTRKLQRDTADESRRTKIGHRNCATYSKYIVVVDYRKFLFSTDKNILENWFNQNRGWRNNFLDRLHTRLIQCHLPFKKNTIITLFSFPQQMEHNILQNGALNIYQHYFDDMVPTELVKPRSLR